MTRMVQCVYLKKEAEGLVYPPYPGELGKRVYENVSKLAWQQWLPWWFALLAVGRDVLIVSGAAAYHFAIGEVVLDRSVVDSLGDRVILNGHPTERLPNTLSVVLPGGDGEALLMALDLEGVCASAGAACTSGSTRPSHVLSAMGLDLDEARATLRLSLGWCSTGEDVDAALRLLPPLVERVRRALQPER